MKKYALKAGVVIVGATLGYLYYYYIGCRSGTCPITSNPWISMGYGAFFGLVLTLGKDKNDKQTKSTPNLEEK